MPQKPKKSAYAPVRRSKAPSAAGSSAWKFAIPVCLITFLLFLPGLRNGFTNFDDPLYVLINDLIRSLAPEGLKAIWSTQVVSNYHPLTIMSLAIDYMAGGLDPLVFHLTNNVLHTLNTGLVFILAMFLSNRNPWVSAFTALAFGIHPMHVESVAWISERKDVLYTFFYLFALISYTRYVINSRRLYLFLATLLGGLSLLAKPMAVVLPASMLTLDYFFRRTWSMRLVAEKLPILVLAALFAWIALNIHHSKQTMATISQITLTERISYAGFGLLWYTIRSVVPWPLSALHPFPNQLNAIYYLAPIASMALAFLIAVRVRSRTILFGLGFFVANLLPILQLVSVGNAVVAERYTYVPYIGLFFIIGMEGYTLITRQRPSLILTAGAIWLACLMILTSLRIPVWKDSQTLWADVLKHYPGSARAWTNKAIDLYEKENWAAVDTHLSKALEVDPNYALALEYRARNYLRLDEPEKALVDATKFHQTYPDREAGFDLYAQALDASNKLADALAAYNELIALFPGQANYHLNRGTLQFNKFKRFAEAKSDFEQAIALAPRDGLAHLNLSRCYYMLSDVQKARQMAARASQLGSPPDKNYASLIGL